MKYQKGGFMKVMIAKMFLLAAGVVFFMNTYADIGPLVYSGAPKYIYDRCFRNNPSDNDKMICLQNFKDCYTGCYKTYQNACKGKTDVQCAQGPQNTFISCKNNCPPTS
jgi:hypothetical protein